VRDGELLRRNQELLAKLFRSNPAAVALVRLSDGMVLDVNEAYERLFGWPRAEVIGRNAEALRVWADPAARARFRDRVAAEGRVADFESQARRKNGEIFDSVVSAEVIEEGGERIALVIVVDVSARKRAEGALRASEERFASMFRQAPEAMTLVRAADGIFLDVNRAWERHTGFARDEAVGRTSLDLGLWLVPQEREAMLRALRQTGSLSDLEFALRRRDGTTRHDLLNGAAIEIAGEPSWLFVLRDITERKHAETALRESEQRFRDLTELFADFYWEQDEHYRFVARVGNAWERRAYPAEQVIGKTRWELQALNLTEADWARHRADLEARREFRNLEVERPLPGGGTRWISTSGRPIFDAEGRFRGYRGVGSDVTERKHAETALRESEQRFRALVDLSSDWYWVTDTEHRFTLREGEILRRMGIPPEADYGKRRWEMGFLNLSEADWAAHRAALERREEFRDLLLERRSADGRVHWATISGRPLYDSAGAFLGYHGTGRDVTQQVLAEQRLRQFNVELERKVAERTAELDAAMQELEAFSYSVSHDLRAPLRAIDGFARMLEEKHAAGLSDEGRAHLQRVRAAARRMGQLIEDLLEFSRIGRTAPRKRAVDLSALAHAVAKELEAGAPARRVQWRLAEGLAAYADPGLARVVLENLLGNAWKYTGKVPHALIEFGRTAAGEFMVRDNGAGFDPAQGASLFQPFRRLHAQEDFEGTGIGLATVRRVVERHGGRVRAEGAVGAGATFYFTLPGA
jgi:PAS domain S-box-containing protein